MLSGTLGGGSLEGLHLCPFMSAQQQIFPAYPYGLNCSGTNPPQSLHVLIVRLPPLEAVLVEGIRLQETR
jgi:hypothetical protein